MKKALIYIILTIILAYAVREILYIGVRKNTIGEYDKLNTIFLKQNNYNALFLGSSRAESHFNPQIIDSITHLNSYNIGLEGATMPLMLAGFEAYLVNSKVPEYLILNIDFHAFRENSDTVHRFPRYFPYLGNDKLYEGLKERDKRFLFFKCFPFYSMPFFGERYLNASLRGYSGMASDFDKSFVKGYAPVPPELVVNMDAADYSIFLSIPQNIVFASLHSIINICKNNKTKLIFVISPMYYKAIDAVKNKEELLEKFKQIANENNLPFMDYTSIEFCKDKTLFADPNHLNKKGSILFSETFGRDLIRYLNGQ